eukprot:1553169-Rhodomonas_salina.1
MVGLGDGGGQLRGRLVNYGPTRVHVVALLGPTRRHVRTWAHHPTPYCQYKADAMAVQSGRYDATEWWYQASRSCASPYAASYPAYQVPTPISYASLRLSPTRVRVAHCA